MKIYGNDRLLVDTKTPADLCDPEEVDQDLIMCEEVYNEISQWVLEAGTVHKIGLRALCIIRCLSLPALPVNGIFSHLETENARKLAKISLRKIFEIIVEGKSIETSGMKAAAVLSGIRSDHVGGVSLREFGTELGCTKQNISKHRKTFSKKVRASCSKNKKSVMRCRRAA